MRIELFVQAGSRQIRCLVRGLQNNSDQMAVPACLKAL